MRAKRRRKADGFAEVAAEVKLDRLVLALAEDGFLGEWSDADPAAIRAAFTSMINTYIVMMIGPDVTP